LSPNLESSAHAHNNIGGGGRAVFLLINKLQLKIIYICSDRT